MAVTDVPLRQRDRRVLPDRRVSPQPGRRAADRLPAGNADNPIYDALQELRDEILLLRESSRFFAELAERLNLRLRQTLTPDRSE